ncbi:amidohydrolase family protein [Alteromonas sp. A079]|uniref:amidohydrolase family protein n=1 Tax=Alteromonas sp. A079 TaxID=3410268 RepID=UPI003B9EF333
MTFTDPHIHFFALSQGHYDWLKSANPPFWKDKDAIAVPVNEIDLRRAGRHRLASFVHIEAGFDNAQPWREIHYLNAHCTLPFKAVGAIDLLSVDALSHIDALNSFTSVVGLRHILDGQAKEILTHPKAKHTLNAMANRQLSFDAQFDVSDSNAVKALLNILDYAPTLRVVINHAGEAPLCEGKANSLRFKRWRQHIQLLGSHERVAIKMSGWEMQDRRWQRDAVSCIIHDLLEQVADDKLMFASNFPLCQWRTSYHTLWQFYGSLVESMPPDSQQRVLSDNASRWYRMT